MDDRVIGEVGSSPLARGLPVGEDPRERAHRIIPARAGFTKRMATVPSLRTDHPRSRGVYEKRNAKNAYYLGSSPLARGLRG